MRIEFQGAKELNARLKEMAQLCPKEINKFMRQETKLVKGRVVLKTPVRHGFLRENWSTLVQGAVGIIYNNTEYAELAA